MHHSETRKRLVRLGAALLLAIAAPIAFSPKTGVAANTCGAQADEAGTCCTQANAICNAGAEDHPGYCYRSEGSCKNTSTEPCN